MVSESTVAGNDTVYTDVGTYSLAANVERLLFDGTGAFNAKGNVLDNYIQAGSGNDTLDGGVGADTLIGGLGDDSYWLDNVTTRSSTAAARTRC